MANVAHPSNPSTKPLSFFQAAGLRGFRIPQPPPLRLDPVKLAKAEADAAWVAGLMAAPDCDCDICFGVKGGAR